MGELGANSPAFRLTAIIAATFIITCCWFPAPSQGQLINTLGNASLFPSQGDLLIGRVAHLTASSTCGESKPQTYCPIGMSKCRTCDSKLEWDPNVNPNSHKIGNVVAKIRNSNTTYDSWWMSEPGIENVTIQFDLDTKFTFTHMIMIFHSYRPRAWWLERSSDYGRTYKPYGYFAEKCDEVFPWVKLEPRKELDDVVCSSLYTRMNPSDGGQVVFNVIPQHISETDIFDDKSVGSKERRELQTDITNLRIHLQSYHTLSDEKLAPDSTEWNKYYFGLYEMNVHGMCICNGHAMTCKPADDMIAIDKNAVYGYCECMHNTQGANCEECRDFYHDRKWAPATLKSANECRRCNCHGHANRCTFSQKKWDESGGKTGGLCQECRHNTTGDNCERCVQGYFRDEVKLLDDPEICLPCQCSTIGSRVGFCESETNKANGVMAGHCYCKEKVTGKNCNRCKPGFWNLRQDNPEGCQECSCVLLGTTGNLGCNQYTGQCNCKKNVDGDRCDRCKPGFYNLSEIAYGCSACRCNIGGSLTPSCHPVTGACSCKPGFTGRQCHIVIDRYYVPNFEIDGSVVQVEDTPDSDRFNKIKKEKEPTLTGECGIEINRIPAGIFVILLRNETKGLPTGEYDVVIKAYPVKISHPLELAVSLVSPGLDSVNCTSRPSVIDERLILPSTEGDGGDGDGGGDSSRRPYVVKPTFRKICVDGRGLDKIIIQLVDLPITNNFVIDAVVIGKNLDDPITHLLSRNPSPSRSVLPPFKIDNAGELVTNLYNCLDYWKASKQSDVMPSECKGFVQGLSGSGLPGALQCSCEEGSRSPVCEKIGGQCKCHPNVVSRTCNQCAPYHYGYQQFRGEGCRFCNCSITGSFSSDCDQETGQCQCIQDSITGRTCDSCKLGFWNFPTCQPCDCNNLAVDCDKQTGDCLACRNNTGGKSCETCQSGYYGDPSNRIPCRRCQCPGGPEGSVQHATTCQLKSQTGSQQQAKCNCQPGYRGDACDQCEVNYYGNPSVGACTKCSCNGNINFTVPESCDPQTGRCTKCLNETTGASCEECRPGFFGDAARGSCSPCYCNENGTVRSELLASPISHKNQIIFHSCNSKSGECRCLPNVEGAICSTCKPLHYNLTSREGCSPCACDPLGSRSLQCDVVTGRCPCQSGRGGRRCDQCLDLFYGDPAKIGPEGCQPCDCHPEGSMTPRCDKVTGKCACKSAITGRRCDQCERGTTGVLPNCTTCGECWYNWDKLIQQLSARNWKLKKHAEEASKTGGLKGDYSDDIRALELDLQTIRRAINETKTPERDIQAVKDKLKLLEDKFSIAKPRLDLLKFNLRNDLNRIRDSDLTALNTMVGEFRNRHKQLRQELKDLRKNMSNPSLIPPSQTLTSINQHARSFNDLQEEVKRTDSDLKSVTLQIESEQVKLNGIKSQADQQLALTKNRLLEVANRLAAVERKLPELNKFMCVGYEGDKTLYNRTTNYCSEVCGGPPGVCNSTISMCGESSVCQGSVAAQMRALDANLAGLEAKIKEANLSLANETRNLTVLTGSAQTAKITAISTEERVKALQIDFEGVRNRASELEKQMQDFIYSKHSNKQEITALVNKIATSAMPIPVDDLLGLAARIKNLLKKLNDSFEASKTSMVANADRQTVLQLLQRAETIARDADKIKNDSLILLEQLGKTKTGLDSSQKLLDEVQNLLNEIQDVAATKLGDAIRTYESLTVSAKAKREQLDGNLNVSVTNRMQINYRVELLAKEQQETKEILNNALAAADKINIKAASEGISVQREEVLRRQETMKQLRARVAEINRKLGGGRGQLIATQSKISSLELSLSHALERIGALMNRLNQDASTPGSLTSMLNLLENRCSNV